MTLVPPRSRTSRFATVAALLVSATASACVPIAARAQAASVSAPADAPLAGAHNLLVRLAPQPMGSNNGVRLWIKGDNSGETLRVRLYQAPPDNSARQAALSAPDWISAPIPVSWTGWRRVSLTRDQFVLRDPGARLNANLPATDQPQEPSDAANPHWADIDAIGVETGVPQKARLDIDDIVWVTEDSTGSETSTVPVATFETGDVAAWQSVGTATQQQALVYGVTTDAADVYSGRVAFHLEVTSPAAARVPLLAAAKHEMLSNHQPYLLWTPANRFDPILPTSLPPAIGADDELTVEAAANQVYGLGFCVYSAKPLTNVTVTMPSDLQGLGHTLSHSIVDVRVVKDQMEPGGGLVRDDDFSSLTPDILVKDDRIALSGLGTVVPLTGDPVTDIPADSTKEFWVTVSVPRDADPGNYVGKLMVSGTGLSSPIPVRLALDVPPIDLEYPAKQYVLNLQSTLDTPPSVLPSPGGHHLVTDYVSSDLLTDQLADIVAHGFRITTLYDSPDTLWTALAQYQANGILSPYIYMGDEDPRAIQSQAAVHDAPALVYFVDPNISERAAQIKTLAQHGFALATFVTQLSDFTALQAQISVPIYNEDSDYSQSLLLSHGKRQFDNQDWWYWPAAQESPLNDRLSAGWSLWRSDLYGAFVPDYQTAFGADPYDLDSAGAAPPNVDLRSQMLTYPVQGGVLDTLRWEAIREGVVDVRYLTTLFDNYRECKDAHIAPLLTAQAMAYVSHLMNKSQDGLTDTDLDAARTELTHFSILLSRQLTAYHKQHHIAQ